jgi:sarcosine oxidase subunit alpha
MTQYRITKHPILEIPAKKKVTFTWNAKQLSGYAGEMISAALFANGVHIFGHHHKDVCQWGPYFRSSSQR